MQVENQRNRKSVRNHDPLRKLIDIYKNILFCVKNTFHADKKK